MLSDEAARSRVRHDFTHNLVVEAGAGTGKTTLLVDRALEAVREHGVPVERIALLTFTEKAASELRDRLRDRLWEAAQAASPGARTRLEGEARRLSAAPVTTLHGLGYALIRQYAPRLGLGSAAVWDAVETVRQQDLAFLAWVRADRQAQRQLEELTAVGVTFRDWRRLLTAWPQDGWAPGGAGPEPVATLVREVADALQALAAGAAAAGVPVEEPGRIQIADLARQAGILQRLPPSSWTGALLAWTWGRALGAQARWRPHADLLRRQKAAIADWRERLDSWRTAWIGAVLHELQDNAARFQAFWAQWRTTHDAVTFEDQVGLALRLLRDNPSVADEVRDGLATIMVDEFQDTDAAQVELVQHLAGGPQVVAGTAPILPGRLVLVGDVKQAIYGFRGADVENAKRWMDRLVQSGNAELIHITENFRSRRPIVEAVNATFATLMTGEALQAAYVPLTGGRAAEGDRAALASLPALHADGADGRREEEAAHIADLLAQAIHEEWPVGSHGRLRPITWSDMALLVPRRTGLSRYREALEARGIPVLSAGSRQFYGLPVIRGMAAALEAVMRPEDAPAVLAALRGAVFRISDWELGAHRMAGGTWHPFDPQPPGPVGDALRELQEWARAWPRWGLLGLCGWVARRQGPQNPEMTANLDRLLRQADQYGRQWGPLGYVSWLHDRVLAGDPEPTAEVPGLAGVELTSIHQAKGLEWPLVVLTGLQGHGLYDGPLLQDPSTGEMALRWGRITTASYETVVERRQAATAAETRRLWYVGMTRARDYLVLGRDLPETLAAAVERLFEGGALETDEGP